MADAHTPLNIRYETEHCIVRELELTDPLEVIGGWMARPEIAKGLNAPARVMDIEELRKYVTSHNRIDSHALGVFDRKTGTLKGLWSVQVDWKTKEFLVNVLLAEKIDSDNGGIRETGRPLYAIMFDDLGMEALRYNILESNDKVLWRPSRQPEHITKINTRTRVHPTPSITSGLPASSTTKTAPGGPSGTSSSGESGKSCVSSGPEPHFPDGEPENPSTVGIGHQPCRTAFAVTSTPA